MGVEGGPYELLVAPGVKSTQLQGPEGFYLRKSSILLLGRYIFFGYLDCYLWDSMDLRRVYGPCSVNGSYSRIWYTAPVLWLLGS